MKENRMGLDTASSMSNLADILEVTEQMGGRQGLCAKSIELYGADSTVALAMSNEEGELVSLNYNHMTDEVMEQFILDEAERYVLGETSLEDAVGAINQKVKLYLAE